MPLCPRFPPPKPERSLVNPLSRRMAAVSPHTHNNAHSPVAFPSSSSASNNSSTNAATSNPSSRISPETTSSGAPTSVTSQSSQHTNEVQVSSLAGASSNTSIAVKQEAKDDSLRSKESHSTEAVLSSSVSDDLIVGREDKNTSGDVPAKVVVKTEPSTSNVGSDKSLLKSHSPVDVGEDSEAMFSRIKDAEIRRSLISIHRLRITLPTLPTPFVPSDLPVADADVLLRFGISLLGTRSSDALAGLSRLYAVSPLRICAALDALVSLYLPLSPGSSSTSAVSIPHPNLNTWCRNGKPASEYPSLHPFVPSSTSSASSPSLLTSPSSPVPQSPSSPIRLISEDPPRRCVVRRRCAPGEPLALLPADALRVVPLAPLSAALGELDDVRVPVAADRSFVLCVDREACSSESGSFRFSCQANAAVTELEGVSGGDKFAVVSLCSVPAGREVSVPQGLFWRTTASPPSVACCCESQKCAVRKFFAARAKFFAAVAEKPFGTRKLCDLEAVAKILGTTVEDMERDADEVGAEGSTGGDEDMDSGTNGGGRTAEEDKERDVGSSSGQSLPKKRLRQN